MRNSYTCVHRRLGVLFRLTLSPVEGTMWNESVSTFPTLTPSGPPPKGFRLYTTDDVARILQVPRKSVYGLGIPEVRPGPRTIRFVPSAFSRWLDDRRREL